MTNYTFASILKRFYAVFIKYLNLNVVISGEKLSINGSKITDYDWSQISLNRCTIMNYSFGICIQKLINSGHTIKYNNQKILNVITIACEIGSDISIYPKKMKETEHAWIVLKLESNTDVAVDLSASQYGIFDKFDNFPFYCWNTNLSQIHFSQQDEITEINQKIIEFEKIAELFSKFECFKFKTILHSYIEIKKIIALF